MSRKHSLAAAALMLTALHATPTLAEDIARTNVYAWEDSVGYAQIVEANGLIFISGVTSDFGDMDQQVERIYSDIKDMLADLNLTMDAIVRENVYTTDVELFKRATSIRKQFFNDGLYPSATWVQVERLYSPGMLVEVELIVVRPE